MSDKVFRALVRLLPEEFRAGYARDMEATFRAERKEADGRWGAMARLWIATIADVLRAAPSEHLDILFRDVRFALRAMATRPVHTLTAIVTLAIGIGANVAMFAVIDGVLLALSLIETRTRWCGLENALQETSPGRWAISRSSISGSDLADSRP